MKQQRVRIQMGQHVTEGSWELFTYHKCVNFETRHNSAGLQGRRLRTTRLSRDTTHSRLIFTRKNISALKEILSLSDNTLASFLKMSHGCVVSRLNRVLRRGVT